MSTATDALSVAAFFAKTAAEIIEANAAGDGEAEYQAILKANDVAMRARFDRENARKERMDRATLPGADK